MGQLCERRHEAGSGPAFAGRRRADEEAQLSVRDMRLRLVPLRIEHLGVELAEVLLKSQALDWRQIDEGSDDRAPVEDALPTGAQPATQTLVDEEERHVLQVRLV